MRIGKWKLEIGNWKLGTGFTTEDTEGTEEELRVES
jgi:hypothetical protein